MRKTTIDLAVVATILTIIAVFYRGSILSYVEMLQLEEYSYLLILAPTSLYIVIELINKYSSMRRLDILRLISLFGGVFIASTLYILSRIAIEYSLQLELLSLVTLISSIILLMYGEFNRVFIPLTIVVLLLLLIPLPRSFLDILSSPFTYYLTWLTSAITGLEMVTEQSIMGIKVVDHLGIPRIIYITSQYSGIAGLLSVIGLLPLILYIALRSIANWKIKTWTVIKAFLVAILIVFIGSILRILLVIVITRDIGYEEALQIFHKIPAIVYIAIAIFTSLYIVSRLPIPKKTMDINTVVDNSTGIIKILTLILIPLLFLATLGIAYTSPTAINQMRIDPIKLFETLNIAIFNATQEDLELRSIPNPRIGGVIGAYTLYNIVIKQNNMVAYGYIELGETPSRFHSWTMCLPIQGYTIDEYWIEVRNTTVTYIVASGYWQKILLAYTIYRYSTYLGDIYIRLTLITPITTQTYSQSLKWINTILNKINMPIQISIQYQSYTLLIYIGLAIMLISTVIRIIYRSRSDKHREEYS